MNLPKITNQQQAILQLLYKHRFLDRTHIQAIMHHKDKPRIITWLKDLREKEYIEWIYDKDDFANKTKPAIYYLNLNGIRYLRTLNEYPPTELRKRYKEPTREQSFIDRCLILADCCVTLEAKSIGEVQYSYVVEADYTDPDNERYFLSDELKPHLCFTKQESAEKTTYLVEIFDATTPHYMLRKRIKDYVVYLNSGDWQDQTKDEQPPIALLACPTKADLIYAKRRTRMLLEDIQDEDTPKAERLHIRFATIEQLKQQGVTSIIWEEA